MYLKSEIKQYFTEKDVEITVYKHTQQPSCDLDFIFLSGDTLVMTRMGTIHGTWCAKVV